MICRFEGGWADITIYKDDVTVKYRYFGLITNDEESSEEGINRFYNKCGSIERVFDQLNNDFNWSHLPSSEMNQNSVFMYLTAMPRNFMLGM